MTKSPKTKKINIENQDFASSLEKLRNALIHQDNSIAQIEKIENEFHLFDEEEIGAIIREKRKSLRLSEKELSEISGVSRSTIQRLENGPADITYKSLRKIMKALGIELAWK